MPKHLFTIPHDTVLPSPAGLPEGYPFRLDPTNVLYTILGGAWVQLTGAGPLGPFTDNFNRSDRVLAGDNGWFASDPTQTASLLISGNKVIVPTGAGIEFGNSPILHRRNDSDPNVADVSVTLTRASTAGITIPVCIADATYQYGLAIEIDGSATAPSLDIITTGAGGPATWDTTDSAWTAWTAVPTTVRMTYNGTTKLFSVYQDGVLRNTVSVQAALNTYYGVGVVTFPALATMPNGGFASNAGVNVESFDNFVCA